MMSELSRQVVDLRSTKVSSQNPPLKYSYNMTMNLKEMAQKMAQAARAGVAIERKRLQEILAERRKKSVSSPR